MKAKGSASLYEVLKSASRAPGEPAPAAPAAGAAPEAGPTSLQERLAAYKALKLAEVATPGAPSPASASPAAAVAVAEATPPPAPPRTVEAARPAAAPPRPVPAPAAAPAPTLVMSPEPEPGPGERVLRLSFNNAAFAALVVVGLLFVAYALGVQSGKRRAAENAPPAVAAPRVAAPVVAESTAPVPPPAPAREYTIRLAEWKYGTAKERLNAGAAADDLKKALERAGVRGAEKMQIQRGAEPRLILIIDRVRDAGTDAARQRLATLQRLKVGAQAPFAQAGYEEIATR